MDLILKNLSVPFFRSGARKILCGQILKTELTGSTNKVIVKIYSRPGRNFSQTIMSFIGLSAHASSLLSTAQKLKIMIAFM